MSTVIQEDLELILEEVNDDLARHKPGCVGGCIFGMDEVTGRVIVIPCCCKSWTCPACANRLRRLWVKRVLLAQPTKFFTWTCDPKLHPDPHEARVAIQKAWTSLVAHWRKGRAARGDKHAIPPHELEYITVWERHKNGHPHMHGLIRGDYIPQSYMRRWSQKSGCGSIVHIEKVENLRGAAAEIFKYVTKAADDVSGFFQGFKLISCSRKFVPGALPEPTSENTPGFTWLACITDAAQAVTVLVQGLGYTIDRNSLPGRVEFAPGDRQWNLPDLVYQVNARSHFSP